MANILIAGGAGFIGSHLCEYLLHNGNFIYCLDNLYTGSQSNLEYLQDNKNFRFIKADITKPLEHLKVDQIYNLACPASPVYYQKDPVFTLKTSFTGVLHLLELARSNKAVFLHCSTSEVYGDPLQHPQKESYWGNVNPVGPRSCYDEGKRAAESLITDFSAQYNIETKIIRIFNTYGPRMQLNDGRVVSNFIVQSLKGEELTIYGKGEQTRSFCFVSDMIRGIVRMMQEKEKGPLNLGNPAERTIKELAELILELTGSGSRMVYQPLPGDDPRRRKPDIGLAQKKLDWEPRISLKQGLKETIACFRKML
ncbi:MAG TPA: UDP-glucuronic acid decarboxylase family protein [Spirochaetota bacterium]|nr:UDP-glucuronic acid decarboxylase family protein [Spirochaetota bacterium]